MTKEANAKWRKKNPGYMAEWRAKNREHIRQTAKEYYYKRAAVLDELKNHPCVDCGGSFPPECMDFDHREGEVKLQEVGTMKNSTPEKMLAEIAKCDLVCANCHRIRTKQRLHKDLN